MDRIQTLRVLVDHARARGARAAEVLLTETTGFRATLSRGRARRQSRPDTQSLVVRVWREGGQEGEATGDLREADALVDRALALAADTVGDPWAGPPGRSAATGTTADIDDRRYGSIDNESRRDVLVTAEKVTRQVSRKLKTSGFAYEDERTTRTYVNSRDVRQTESGTRFAIQGTVSHPCLELSLTERLEGRAYATVASLPFGVGLARRLLEIDGDTTTAEGPHRVVLPPSVMAELAALLAPHFRREALEAGSSFLARARAGGPLRFSPKLHLVDDGLLPGGLRSASFDDRGVGPVPLTLVRDGRVDGWYLDQGQARREDVRPTGHVWGEGLRPSNLILRGGARSVNALLSDQSVPVVVLDHVRGLAEGLDVVTGALNCAATGRLVVPRNETVGWMPRLRIEGDLTEVLAQVIDLASDTDRFGHVDAPAVMVDGLTLHMDG